MNIEHQALSLTSTTYIGQSYIPTPATFLLQAGKLFRNGFDEHDQIQSPNFQDYIPIRHPWDKLEQA